MRDKDLFISYSSKDKPFVERLARDLARFGIKVWWDQGEIKIGDSLNRKIQEGIVNSRWLAVVLSPHSVASPWVERELNAALIEELERREVFVLPLLHSGCELPVFLRDKRYADFSRTYERGLARLLERVKPSVDSTCVTELLSDDESRVQRAVARIGEADREGYRQLLLRCLNDSSEGNESRLGAMTALFALRSPGLALTFAEVARIGLPSMRRRALFYLGEIRARVALDVVTYCLSDRVPEIRAEAREAYRKITGTMPPRS